VIGGGDWAKDRLIPDVVESISNGKSVTIRNPSAVRPWQHVLEPLSGYLLLGQKLLNGEVNLAQAWNFGPDNEGVINVEQILAQVQQYWNHLKYYVEHNDNQPHEASYLALDCTKANKELNWRPVWNIQETIKHTIGWYKQYYLENKVVTDDDISSYVNRAKELNISWTD
jgi:CDP-glucose 4,6-dehydratase